MATTLTDIDRIRFGGEKKKKNSGEVDQCGYG